MLGHHRRQWPKIKPPFGQSLMFYGGINTITPLPSLIWLLNTLSQNTILVVFDEHRDVILQLSFLYFPAPVFRTWYTHFNLSGTDILRLSWLGRLLTLTPWVLWLKSLLLCCWPFQMVPRQDYSKSGWRPAHSYGAGTVFGAREY